MYQDNQAVFEISRFNLKNVGQEYFGLFVPRHLHQKKKKKKEYLYLWL